MVAKEHPTMLEQLLSNSFQARDVLEEQREGEAQEREAEISRLLRELWILQSQLKVVNGCSPLLLF